MRHVQTFDEAYLLYLKEKRLKDTRLWVVLTPEEASFKDQVRIMESMMERR